MPHRPLLPPPRPAPPPRPVPKPPSDAPSPPLLHAIEREFGSLEGFRRTLARMLRSRHGGYVNLVCSPRGRLRLVRTPAHVMPHGRLLLRLPAQPSARPPRLDWPAMSAAYEAHMDCRPPYPMP